MIAPPENHGSSGGITVERTVALRYARSMGFSPPNHGFHRSGLAMRMSTNTPNAPKNSASLPSSSRHRCRTKADSSSLCRWASHSDSAASAPSPSSTDPWLNATHLRLASSHAMYAVRSRPRIRAGRYPRSGRTRKTISPRGSVASATP